MVKVLRIASEQHLVENTDADLLEVSQLGVDLCTGDTCLVNQY